MFDNLEKLDESIREYLADFRFYSRQSWVLPQRSLTGEKVQDVAIVGAGQGGLALAYNLKLRGVRRLAVLDAQPADQPGPWSSFARMKQLRTPKSISALECGNPLLSFKAWFCSRYSRAEYERFEFIPLDSFREYLRWYRKILEIDTINERTVIDTTWNREGRYFELALADAEGRPAGTCCARRVCLATGIAAAGHWAPPTGTYEQLPHDSWSGAWDAIDWSRFAGRDVAVLGSGASGFDNAIAALNAGCKSVTVFSRTALPHEDVYFELWRGRDDSRVYPDEAGSPGADLLDPLLAHNAALPDADRVRLLRMLFRHGRSPSNPEYLARVSELERIHRVEGTPIDRTEWLAASGKVRLHAGSQPHDFDHLIFATGVQAGLENRPELASITSQVLTWGDCVSEPLPLALERYPKLSRDFQLQPRDTRDAHLGYVYSLADIVHTTVGLQSLAHVVIGVAKHIAFSLYEAQHSANLRFLGDISNRQHVSGT